MTWLVVGWWLVGELVVRYGVIGLIVGDYAGGWVFWWVGLLDWAAGLSGGCVQLNHWFRRLV
jgi:hypothetical protein